jgi:hypothetical protein
MNLFVVLHSAQQAHAAITALYQTLKPHLLSGHKFELQVRPEKRNSEQNALLHAELTELARAVPWAGKLRDVDTWKRLMTAAWLRARGESIEILPAIDGHGVDVVFRRTSTLTRAECSELIEYLIAWKAQNVEQAEASA